MTIKDTIAERVNNYVSCHGYTTIMSRQEIYNLISPDHTLNYNSILPQDYCYNRMNDGIVFKDHIHLFEYLGRNRYRLLGDRYPYTGEILHKPKQCPELIVGKWEQGALILQKEVGRKNTCWSMNSRGPRRAKKEAQKAKKRQIELVEITVFDDHLAFEFKCGLETEVKM